MQNPTLTTLEESRQKIFGTNNTSKVFPKLCGTINLQKSLDILQDMIIIDALKRNNYIITTTAQHLHTSRETIKRTCTKYGIKVVTERQKQKLLHLSTQSTLPRRQVALVNQ